MHDKIRVAIAGQGRSGFSIHARAIERLSDRYEIVAVADQLPERQDEARAAFGARTYSDWSELISDGDFDLFVNALPSPLHPPATIAALDAGKHVLCEKPMAPTVDAFDRMVEAARRNNRLLVPFQNNRPQPFFEKIRDVIDSGVLGKIVYIRSSWSGFARRWDWQTWQHYNGGSLYNTGPHAIDQALCLFGFDRQPQVFCRMDCNNAFGADAEDHCTVTLYDPERERPQIDVIISAYAAFGQSDRYWINGTHGGLAGGETTLTWRYFDPQTAPRQELWKWSVDRRYPGEELPWVVENWSLDEERLSGSSGYTLRSLASGHDRIYDNLHDVLTGRAHELMIKPEEIRRQIAVLEECHRQNPLPRHPNPPV